MAIRSAQSGIGSRGGLILADADLVEESNLDVMMLPPQAQGMPKAIAAARMIKALCPDANVVPIVGTVSDQMVAEAIIAADVIFSSVDEDYARIGVAALATRYHRLHVDVSGGVAYIGKDATATGGEIRVGIPGSSGCVGCFGRYDWHDIERLLSLSAQEEKGRLSTPTGAHRELGHGATF